VSGSGKIAMHVLEKLIAYGALPISVSGNIVFYYEYRGVAACTTMLSVLFYSSKNENLCLVNKSRIIPLYIPSLQGVFL